MALYTTEIASDQIASDNPIHQRLLRPYQLIAESVKGKNVLEVGCGEGRGVGLMISNAKSFTAIDKIEEVVKSLAVQYPEGKFRQMFIPPFGEIADNFYDVVVSFQVIEHIKDDALFLSEIYRVLKPGGKAFITTPNRIMTLTRNPWHIREYTASELTKLASTIFSKVEMKGIAGNDKVMEYYDQNKRSVEKITRFDILNLQHRLPAFLLRIPYDLLNRLNRNKLKSGNNSLVLSITAEDYLLSESPDTSLDLFLHLEK